MEDPQKAHQRDQILWKKARKQQAIIQQCIVSIRELKSRMEHAKYRLWQIHNERKIYTLTVSESTQ